MQVAHAHADIASHLVTNTQNPRLVVRDNSLAREPKRVVHLIGSDLHLFGSVSEIFALSGVDIVRKHSLEDYSEQTETGETVCLVVDIKLTGDKSGDLQEQMVHATSRPIIFVSDQPDVRSTVRAMKAGAVSILAKPINPSALIEAVGEAFSQDRKQQSRQAEMTKLRGRFSLLTPREREVIPLIVGGLLNKQSAWILGISEVTLQIHRSQVMRKMEAQSLADLVRIALRLRIPYWRPKCGEVHATDMQIVRRSV